MLMQKITDYHVHAARVKILIVDDSVSMRKLIHAIIAHMGLSQIDEATDGQHATQMIEKSNYDLIISDWKMEPMDGLELCHWLRSHANTKLSAIPFLLVSAFYDSELEKIAQKTGVNQVLKKPIAPENIRNFIENLIIQKSKAA